MTFAVTVEMVGGPFDGQLLAVPGTDDGAPREPVMFTTHCLANTRAAEVGEDGVHENVHLGLRRGRYELHLSPRDDGPLWQYRFRGTVAY